jgi:ketosteroid isomerase-like protein
MGAAENKEAIRNMFAELSKGNADAFLGALADNVRFTIIGSTKFSGTFNGKQEFINKVLAPLGAQLEGGLSMTVDNLIAEGDYVAMQARGKSNTKSGGTYNNTYCQVFKLNNGKVQEATEYLDTEVVTKSFGK